MTHSHKLFKIAKYLKDNKFYKESEIIAKLAQVNVPITEPWSRMNLPLRGGKITLSSNTNLSVTYDDADPDILFKLYRDDIQMPVTNPKDSQVAPGVVNPPQISRKYVPGVNVPNFNDGGAPLSNPTRAAGNWIADPRTYSEVPQNGGKLITQEFYKYNDALQNVRSLYRLKLTVVSFLNAAGSTLVSPGQQSWGDWADPTDHLTPSGKGVFSEDPVQVKVDISIYK